MPRNDPPALANPALETLPTAVAVQLLRHLFSAFDGAFALRLWSGVTQRFGAAPPSFTLVLRDPSLLRELARRRSPLALVEAYFHGQLDVEGDLYAALRLKSHFQALSLTARERARVWYAALRLAFTPRARHEAVGPVRHAHRFRHRHSLESDRDAISHHYDVSNAFYRLFLDERMVYSCACFHRGDDTLDVAQAQKLDHICRKLRLRPGERLLDIGCGWGALVIWAAQHHGVRAHGITLSRAQLEEAQRRIAAAGLADRVTVELRDYRALEGCAVYDKVASVGMLEHVGLARLPQYHAVVHRVLKPNGLFLNHGITHEEDGWHRNVSAEFINRYVFPDGELDRVSNIQRSMEAAAFEIHDVENLRMHYAKTLRHWVARLEDHHAEALTHVSEATYRVWRLYMAACALEFEAGGTGIYQILASRRPDRRPYASPVPWTREDLYTPLKPC